MPPRTPLPLLIGAVLLFGVLTFLLGMVVGANLVAGPEPVPAVKPALVPPSPVTPPAVPPPAPPPPASTPPASTPSPAAAPLPPAAPPAAAQASADASPALKPMKVKGFGFGDPPSAPLTSSLRGALLEQAANAPPPALHPVPADPGQAAAASTAAPPVVPVGKDATPPMVYSVAVGRFLTEARAGTMSSAAAAKGFSPLVVVADPPDPTGWLTVTLGPQEDAAQAKRLAKEAQAQGFDTWMVSWLPP